MPPSGNRARVWELLRPVLTVARIGLLAGGAIFAVGGSAPSGIPASAAPATAGPVSVLVLPTVGLADGQGIAVHAEAPAGTQIYEIAARICQPLSNITNEVDFGVAGRFCWGPTAASPTARLGSADAIQSAPFPAGVQAGDLTTFKVGTGTVQWIDERGFPHSFSCGPGKPCNLVVRVQVTGATVFANVPICFGFGCPAEPEPVAPPAPPGADAGVPGSGGGASGESKGAGGESVAPESSGAESAASTTTTTVVPDCIRRSGTTTSTAPTTSTTTVAVPSDAAAATTTTTTSASTTTTTVPDCPPDSISLPKDSSRGTRVFVAGIVGALGGARVVQISNRARKRKTSGGIA